MTRIDGIVSSEPHTAGAATIGSELPDDRVSARWRRVARRGLLAVPVALALAIPAPALAQTTGATTNVTSGYATKPPVTTKTEQEPKSGTAPSKEATTPQAKATPAPTTTTPATTPAPTTTTPVATESKLPFTGLDLRWVLGAGLLLLAGGLSIRLTQRRSAGR
jgi:hypothetical protein